MLNKNKEFNWIQLAKVLGIIGIILLALIIIWIVSDKEIFQWFNRIDPEKASQIGGFIGGIVGVFWTAAAAVLIYATFQEQKKFTQKQQFETVFFQMINYLMDTIGNTKGKIKYMEKGLIYDKEYNGIEFFSTV